MQTQVSLQLSPMLQGTVVPLKTLVLTAVERNLFLRARTIEDRSLETLVQAAESVFDPIAQTANSYTRGLQSLLLPDPVGTTSGAQSLGNFGGGLSGKLPTSISYSVSMLSDWKRQNNQLLLSEGGHNLNFNSILTVGVTQPLLRGRGSSIAKAPIEQAALTVRSSRERLGRLIEETIGQVEFAYWSLGFAEAAERLARDSYDRAVVLLQRNEQMRALQLIAAVDLITARQGVAARLTAVTDAARQRQDASDRLVFFVHGQEAEAVLRSSTFIVETEPPPIAGPALPPVEVLETQALSARRDVRATQLDLERTAVNLRVARNSLLPDLSLTASYSAQVLGTDKVRLFTLDRIGDLRFGGLSGGFVVNYPIGNSFARASLAQARLSQDQQRLVVASVENVVRNEVREAARAIRSDRERLAQAEQSLQLAREQYEAGQRQLQLDLLDSFRLLQMEEAVASAELVVTQVRYDLARAIASYEVATGTIDEKYLPAGSTVK